MRLFVALDVADVLRREIARFAEAMRGFAPDAHWARAESLHITLKFIGNVPPGDRPRFEQALTQASSIGGLPTMVEA